eukprot:1643976-Pleurochrysis_carterae.AAC.1
MQIDKWDGTVERNEPVSYSEEKQDVSDNRHMTIFSNINGYRCVSFFYGNNELCYYIGKEDIMNDILTKQSPGSRNSHGDYGYTSYTDYDMLRTMRTETIYRPYFVNGNLRGLRNFQDQDAEKKIRSIFESVQTAELLAQ